ncbi:hypothetical protein [Roseomonas indoligenes]|uniref:Uncharacterized protein n=1 Tax=Roseomonas indoligenes TaxID=2820811 RepID=A0A940S544_9PROT|nr:hypothetical protein [Pararoseomonas indoligenes]MBP0494006.1 hypothetical protein [Pararoseomonas indoligenes]
MPLPPDPLVGSPDPSSARIAPTENLTHPTYGEIGLWVLKAMGEAPSPGTVGRMELLRIWDVLGRDARKELVNAGRVLLAREMGGAGDGE